ncbi:MAG TPA: response regulator [Chryseosolibacter sp.]|nr:response regulator [Chryseosolibacter sp.]
MPRFRILLIDDDEDDRWLFSEAITRTLPAAECITIAGGVEALNLLRSGNSPLPHVIFLDLNMPGMDGLKCLEHMKGDPALRQIPVFVYSTSNFHRDIEQAYRHGAEQFIIKPSDFNHLCSLLKELLGDRAAG